ncbi:LCP family protein [Candidatus Saccharibacteria bacterium]|nr:LCP family protein [Candidatus Saccharibacteria bacterium]
MDKNKSIDGLAPRRSKTRATSSRAVAKPKTVKKTIKVTSPKSASKPTPSTAKKTTSKPTKTSVKKPAPKPVDITEEFLKPVQTFNFDEQTGELKASEDQTMNKEKELSKKEQKKLDKKLKKQNKKPISKKRKIITGIILGIVVLLLAGVIWFIIWGNDLLARIGNGEGNIFSLFTEYYEPLKTDENGRTNILAFGTSGYNMDGDEGNGVHDGAQLTDSIMVISLNQETGDTAMLSLPRDLKVSRTCTATGKINEIYWCNNMDGEHETEGAEALMAEVSDILGLDFQYYAHLNWGSLVSIVDILGGITVTLDENISDYNYTKAVFEAGVPYTIDGAQALGLARARHGTASGDFSRGASQQKILIGIKEKILEKNLSLPDLLNLANTLGDNLRTNFSVDEMKTAAHLLTDLDFNSIRQVSLIEPEKLMTTGSIGGISYVLPSAGNGNYSAIKAYVAKMFSNNPQEYENSSILVLNGTGTPGVASAEQTTLEGEGYINIYVDDAPAGEYTEHYTLYVLHDDKPGTKKLLEEKYGQEAKPATDLPAGIVTDCDFVIIIGNEAQE